MASDCVLIGQPYEGCAILYWNWLSTCFNPCPKLSRNFCAGEISYVDGHLFILVCLCASKDFDTVDHSILLEKLKHK